MFRFAFGLSLIAALCLAAAAADNGAIKTYGGVVDYHLGIPVDTSKPVSSLDAIDFRDFTFSLFPTGDVARGGTVQSPDGSDRPIVVPVAGGRYDRRSDDKPIGFDVVQSQVVPLGHDPGAQAAIVFGVLYTDSQGKSCTGVVQIFEARKSKLILVDQISYDCRGGTNTHYDAKKRQLTVESARYSAGDQPCCPSLTDHVEFKLEGDRVRASNVHVIE